jgi:hypothetical protein
MDRRFGGGAILRWQGAGTDEDDRRHPGPVACSSAPVLLQATGSGSRSDTAGPATEQKPGLSPAEFCFGLIVSGGPAITRTDACSDSAQGRCLGVNGEMRVADEKQVSAA